MLHIYGMKKDGDEVPTPSKVPQVDPKIAVAQGMKSQTYIDILLELSYNNSRII